MRICDLDRRFAVIHKTTDREDSAAANYLSASSEDANGMPWSDLLKNPLVVVLGEAGSGKSIELRLQRDALRLRNELAFLLPLERMRTEPISSILSSQDYESFERWRSGSNQATFFLDSVDESKQRQSDDFLTSLDRLHNELNARQIKRAKFIISSRISDWRPTTDAGAVESRFGAAARNSDHHGTGKHLLTVVQICPLDESKVARLAMHRLGNQERSNLFLAAIHASHAWMFARRPIDVTELIQYWSANGRLGTLTEIIEFDIGEKLRETESKSLADILSPERARIGAEALAAAVFLSRIPNFIVPDDGGSSHLFGGIALNPMHCLPTDWTPGECRSLISRALFDGESYGLVRFHHRTVCEYLAASWLSERIRQGCPIPTLHELLFAEFDGRLHVRPPLAPVAVWLCSGTDRWCDRVRGWMLDAAPQALLVGGDPASMQIEFRRQVIAGLIKKSEGRNEVWMDTDVSSLARFASDELATDLGERISDPTVIDSIRITFLSIARHGRLMSCVPEAIKIVTSTTASHDLKMYAAALVRDVAKREEHALIASWCMTQSHIHPSLAAICFESVVPSSCSPTEAVRLLGAVDRQFGPANRGGWIIANHVKRAVDSQFAIPMVGPILELLESRCVSLSDDPDDGSAISKTDDWLVGVAVEVAAAAIRSASLKPEHLDDLVRLLEFLDTSVLESSFERSKYSELRATLRNDSRVREPYLTNVIRSDGSTGKPPTVPRIRYRLFSSSALIPIGEDDWDWIRKRLEGDATLEAKRQFLSAAEPILPRNGLAGLRAWASLASVALSNRSLARPIAIIGMRRFVAPMNRLRWSVSRSVANKYWWRHKGRLIPQSKQRVDDFIFLTFRLSQVRTAKNTHALGFLASEASRNDSLTADDWDRLAANRGKRVATAVKAGCIAFWRSFRPKLPDQQGTSIPWRFYAGLAGLQLEYERSGFKQLSEADAETATHYALCDLNGPPRWINSLAALHSKPFLKVVGLATDIDWNVEASQESFQGIVVSKFSMNASLAGLVSALLLDRLSIENPRHPRVLAKCLEILSLANASRAELIRLARRRVLAATIADKSWYIWIELWLQTEALSALEYLSTVLAAETQATEILVNVATCHLGLRAAPGPRFAVPDYLNTESLFRFSVLLYTYVRPLEDLSHEDGPYSPQPRDDAQQFRSLLLQRLSEKGTAEAERLLRDLSDMPIAAEVRDWLLHLADSTRQMRAAASPWTAQDVRLFEREYEREPNSHFDLFEIALRRLSDVADEVETGDKGWRFQVMKPGDEEGSSEPVLRIWLAAKLEELSRKRYTTPQEVEVDKGKHPDIRIEHPKCGVIPIELKWADHWSHQQLLDGLEVQLIGQYMKSPSVLFGVYVVGFKRVTRTWRSVSTNNPISKAELMESLRRRAVDLERLNPRIERVRVVSIDFSH